MLRIVNYTTTCCQWVESGCHAVDHADPTRSTCDLALASVELGWGAADRTDGAIAEGDYVYALSEGQFAGMPYVSHDVFRIAGDRAVEHWDVMIEQACVSMHNNGVF
jgi:hypothetical protein